MTDDDFHDYCRRVLEQVQDDQLTPHQVLSLGGYLATCALNLAKPQHRLRVLRNFERGIRHALASTRAAVDAVHHAGQRFDA